MWWCEASGIVRFWEGWFGRKGGGVFKRVVGGGAVEYNIVKSVYIFALYLFISTKNPIIIWRFC